LRPRMRPRSDTRAALAKALAWLCTSVRVTDSGSPDYGAILHGFDGRTRKPLDVYTEITGYAISLFQFLARTLGDATLLAMAKEAAQFLMRIQAGGSAYPQLSGIAGPARLYAFDTAVCIVGMARLLRATGDERYLRSAITAGEWLLGMQRPDGSFSAMALDGGGIEDPGGFFGDGSCIHAKNAIAFLELHAITGREQFREAAARACLYTLTLQDTDGAFWNRPDRLSVFTHAHCYACEGLLYAGHVLGEPGYMAAARRGIGWLADTQRSDGAWLSNRKTPWSLRGMLESIQRPRPSDAAAQAARLFSLTAPRYEPNRLSALQFLMRCQKNGAFYYQRTAFEYNQKLYTWCAQFAVQALTWNTRSAEMEDLF
jgi:squalene-hopene cyclase-like protein